MKNKQGMNWKSKYAVYRHEGSNDRNNFAESSSKLFHFAIRKEVVTFSPLTCSCFMES